VNVIGAHQIYRAAVDLGIKRVVVSSTLEVLCGFDWTASGVAVYDETMPARPDWIYPASKHLVEELGHYYAREFGLEVIQLRYSWVRDVPVRTLGMGLLGRSVAASDVAEANLLACTKPGLTDHVFIIGADSPLKRPDMMKALSDPESVLEKYWPGSVDVLKKNEVKILSKAFWPVLNISSAKQILGWQPKVGFEDFLTEIGWKRGASTTASA
jgi:nucleoside-diphosphate-sugar epimerase